MPDTNKKRYAITVDLYIYAEDDSKALKAAIAFCDEQKRLNDNRCHLHSLSEEPFGKLGQSRQIDLP